MSCLGIWNSPIRLLWTTFVCTSFHTWGSRSCRLILSDLHWNLYVELHFHIFQLMLFLNLYAYFLVLSNYPHHAEISSFLPVVPLLYVRIASIQWRKTCEQEHSISWTQRASSKCFSSFSRKEVIQCLFLLHLTIPWWVLYSSFIDQRTVRNFRVSIIVFSFIFFLSW